MPRFTANIAFLFTEHAFLDRIDAARSAGFERVECHFPYDVPVAELKARLDAAGVRMTGLNTVPGDASAGEWGRAGMPGREEAFRADLEQALHYATELGCSVIHVMAGQPPEDRRAEALETYITNLRWAGRRAAGTGVTLVLEPLNHRDRPGYLVSRSDEIAALLGAIGEPNVKLLFDVYHVQIMEGDLTRRIERHAAAIGHVQLAAVPSRAEPDEGEVSVPGVLHALDAIGYDGLIGLEYKPRGRTEDGLGWWRALAG